MQFKTISHHKAVTCIASVGKVALWGLFEAWGRCNGSFVAGHKKGASYCTSLAPNRTVTGAKV